VKETGRQGLPAEAVLRCALLKQYRQLSYEADAASFRAFARLPWPWRPRKSVLQRTISALRAATWEALNRTLLWGARRAKLEDGSGYRVRLGRGAPTPLRPDNRLARLAPSPAVGAPGGAARTVTAAPIHEPSDSSLLWDAVRVMVRLLKAAAAWLGGDGPLWRDHRRAAKKRWRAIEFTRGRPKRVPLYTTHQMQEAAGL
jgi:transposase, IS5 family